MFFWNTPRLCDYFMFAYIEETSDHHHHPHGTGTINLNTKRMGDVVDAREGELMKSWMWWRVVCGAAGMKVIDKLSSTRSFINIQRGPRNHQSNTFGYFIIICFAQAKEGSGRGINYIIIRKRKNCNMFHLFININSPLSIDCYPTHPLYYSIGTLSTHYVSTLFHHPDVHLLLRLHLLFIPSLYYFAGHIVESCLNQWYPTSDSRIFSFEFNPQKNNDTGYSTGQGWWSSPVCGWRMSFPIQDYSVDVVVEDVTFCWTTMST